MVVSLYVCEIPNNVTKENIEDLFSAVEGYIETRTKVANDKRTIAFIDFQTERDAKCAKDTLQGFRFTDRDKGLIIKISDNTKGGQSQNYHKNHKKNFLHSKRQRSSSHSESRNKSDNFNNNYTPNNINNNSNNFADLLNYKFEPSGSGNNNITPSLGSNLNPAQTQAFQQNFLKLLEHQTPPQTSIQDNQIDNPILQSNPTFVNNLQVLQLLYSQINKNSALSQKKDSFSFKDDFFKFDDNFYDYEKFNSSATNIVYVEGIPFGATEREIAHIFRPFPGFQNIRIIPKEKNGKKTIICFVDFEDTAQSTLCIRTLQGYRFDKNDLVGLHFSYGVSKNNKK